MRPLIFAGDFFAGDLLPASTPRGPPLALVFTLRLSITPAGGAAYHTGRWRGGPASQKPRCHDHRFVDGVKHATLAHLVETVPDRGKRRKVLAQA